MQTRILALVASIVLAFGTGISSAGAAVRPRHHHHHRLRVRLPPGYGLWAHVAICESGGWRVLGAAYPDPFGITVTNWLWVGGAPMSVGSVTGAARVQAVRVADRLVRRLHIPIPDQGGCWPW